MTRRIPPQVIEHPVFYQCFPDYPLYTSNPEFIQDEIGHTHCRILVPKCYMGVLIGFRGKTIKRLSQNHEVHVQTWNEGSVVVERGTYNIPVMWATTTPSFILQGYVDDVMSLIHEFCDIIEQTKTLKYNYKNILKDHSTKTLYEKQCRKNIRHTNDVTRSLGPSQLYEKCHQRISNYFPKSAGQMSSYILENLDMDTICEIMCDDDALERCLTDVEDIITSNGKITPYIQKQIRAHEQKGWEYDIIERGQAVKELTFDEQLEGEKFVLEQMMWEI
jgi:hypothetical protein